MERNKEKTAFHTRSGQLYEFNQVPFGLCNAPATFSRLMDRILSGLHWETCLFYLDDIIVFSSTWKEHLARLRQVFERLRHANLKLGAEKCTFAAKEFSYLGHWVTEEGLLPDSALLTAIREIPPPITATKVRSFLRSRRLLPAICEELSSHRRSFTRSDQEGCGLRLERRLPGCLRSSQNTPHDQSYHCLPGLQPGLPVIHRLIDCRPRCDPGSCPRW